MLFIYDSCFDKVFGKLIDDLAAMLGDDTLVVLDSDFLANVAQFVHNFPQSASLEHEQRRVARSQ